MSLAGMEYCASLGEIHDIVSGKYAAAVDVCMLIFMGILRLPVMADAFFCPDGSRLFD